MKGPKARGGRARGEGARGGSRPSPFARPPLASFALLLLLASVPLACACRREAGHGPERARAAWDSGDYRAAAEEYEAYLARNPAGEESLQARFQLANIYYLNLRRPDQARAHYDEFLKEDPANSRAPLARERLAEVLSEMGRSYDAIAEYEKLNPREAAERRRIRLRIADLYFDQKNYSQALTEYAKVIEGADYDDLSERAYLREASIYNARGQYQLSLGVYEKLASLSRDAAARLRATYGIADCYEGLYKFDEAIKTLREIKDDAEREHVARRITQLEQQKREAAQARTGLNQ
ncbi:MAG: tetratricopeptide repeat protein [Blastocatellia bacterium]